MYFQLQHRAKRAVNANWPWWAVLCESNAKNKKINRIITGIFRSTSERKKNETPVLARIREQREEAKFIDRYRRTIGRLETAGQKHSNLYRILSLHEIAK